MKKLLLIFIMMLLFVPVAYGMENIYGHFQIGCVTETEGFEANLQVGFQPWTWLDVSGGVSVQMVYAGRSVLFSPFRDTYYVQAQVNLTDNLYLEAYHHCAHMVWANRYDLYWDNYGDGNRTMFSIGYRWSQIKIRREE